MNRITPLFISYHKNMDQLNKSCFHKYDYRRSWRERVGENSPKRCCIINEMRRMNSLQPASSSGAHAWWSSITPIDQLLCQASQFLMSCEKNPTQWNKSRYRANKLLMAVWDFYLLACSYTWQRLKGVQLRKEVKLWLFNYLIFMNSGVVCSCCWTGWIILRA